MKNTFRPSSFSEQNRKPKCTQQNISYLGLVNYSETLLILYDELVCIGRVGHQLYNGVSPCHPCVVQAVAINFSSPGRKRQCLAAKLVQLIKKKKPQVCELFAFLTKIKGYTLYLDSLQYLNKKDNKKSGLINTTIHDCQFLLSCHGVSSGYKNFASQA